MHDAYRSALRIRLTSELDDRVRSDELVDGLDDSALERLARWVPLDEVATSDRLSHRFDPVPLESLDAVIVFAFGHRVAPDDPFVPGPVNEAMAAALAPLVAGSSVPVYSQPEGAEPLRALGVDVVAIERELDANGEIVYQSTVSFLEQVRVHAESRGVVLTRVGVVGFAWHLGRCVLTTRAAGFDAHPIEGVIPPSEFDDASAQPWTCSAEVWFPADLVARTLL